MGFSGVLLAMTAVTAVSQITQGYKQKAENNFNATLYEGKANTIEANSEIEQGQYQRLKGEHLSTSMANIAASGIAPEGSSLAFMIESQRQIEIDQAIAKFNSTQEKNYTNAQASAERRAGKQAVYNGYSNAFSTALQGASNYAMYNNPLKTK